MNAMIHGTSLQRTSNQQQGTSLRSASRIAVPSAALFSALLLGSLLPGCGGGGHPPPTLSGVAPGTIGPQTDPRLFPALSRSFVADPSSGGHASSLRMTQVLWGRLANIRDTIGTDPQGNEIAGDLQNTEYVIGKDIHDDGDFHLEINPITEETTVRIRHLAGTPDYATAFARLDQNLIPVFDKSLDPSALPPFAQVARNAVMVLVFNDLLDSTKINRDNIRLITGYPVVTPFDGRVIPDINHGDLVDNDGDGVLEFYTTRVILDSTVSPTEAAQPNPLLPNETIPPIPVNNLGLPASLNTTQANVGIRIPTQRDASVGQVDILTNLSNTALTFSVSANGSIDSSVSTHDVVRGFRSGGSTAITGDADNGFLPDDIRPRIVGVQPIQVLGIAGTGPDYTGNVDYVLDACAPNRLKVGDTIQQSSGIAEVTQAGNQSSGGTVTEMHFRMVGTGVLIPGPAQIFTLWDPVANFGKEGCFMRYSAVAPGQLQPGTGVSSDGRVLLRFSEPMDPATVTAFDNFPVLRVDPAANTPTARQYVIGAVVPSSDLKEYSFNPVINFKHTLGSSTDNYWVNVGSDLPGTTGVLEGPLDLAGNTLLNPLPAIRFSIDPADATENNGGLVFRFSSLDELDNNITPEWRGQFLADVVGGRLLPRPVTRYSATCDRTIPVPSVMPIFAQGVQTPLSSLGSKMQTLWRYCDVGMALIDESNYNVDVEHLYWAPVGGNVVADSFDQFEIRLCHTNKLPDETIDPTSLLPIYPNSGLVDTYNNNILDPTNDPQRVVHPRSLGYVINPADRKPSGTGAETIMPFPLNRTIPVSQYQYYTWRDTALLSKGAIGDSPGAELRIVCSVVYGLGLGCYGCPYTNFGGTNPVPSIGLPLLMEFRCFPDSGALGLNSLDINLAINSSSMPNFRTFSTGGTNSSGQQVQVNPDLNNIATGGYNPTSLPPGAPTLRFDNTVYLGQMDLVLRISRAHSIWLDTQINAPTYLAPVVEPRDIDQPLGTRIDLAYRGATAISPAGAKISTDASFLDMYGNPSMCPVVPPPMNACAVVLCTTNGVVTFLGNNATWRNSLTQINTAKFFQVRTTFVSNTETSLSPTLSALGFAFRQ